MGTEVFPVGTIAMGSGDLLDVYNVDLTITSNKKQISTIRKPGAGIFKGVEECTVTFSSKIGENGEELDYVEMVKKNQITSLRLKIPNRTMTIEGGYSETKITTSLDDAIDLQATFVGHVVD